MADPCTFSLESIRDFILKKGGKVTNHELVKHFKVALTNPESQSEARNHFKEIVNTLATISRNEEGEKYLVLKKKYRNDPPPSTNASQGVTYASLVFPKPSTEYAIPHAAPPLPQSPPPPLPVSPAPTLSRCSSGEAVFYECSEISFPGNQAAAEELSTPPAHKKEVDTPPVPPRRKSSDKLKLENKENEEVVKRPKPITADPEACEALVEDSKISVKECTQKFNKLALESNQHNKVQMVKKRIEKASAERDDDDTSSNTLLDARSREWLIRCSQANYQAIAKLASENPKLVKLKDPTNGYTALHWAAKHGNVDVIKLVAGTHGADVNRRTNGGYTPLHIAMQFGHKELYNVLVDVYGADPNLRDWSGKRAMQYLPGKSTSETGDTIRRFEKRDLRGNKGKEKASSGKRLGFFEDWISKRPSETDN